MPFARGLRPSRPAALAALALLAAPAAAQDPAPSYFSEPEDRVRFVVEGLLRQEWTDSLEEGGESDSRRRARALVGLELDLGAVELGVGGDFSYSSDEDPEPLARPTRDNYRQRDARLDLAWLRLDLGPLLLEGGRFRMPLPLTEMIWDRDLRPQGGAATIELEDMGGLKRLALTGIAARGSHVFDDGDTTLVGGAAGLTIGNESGGELELAGSFLRFTELGELEPAIRRQNRNAAGVFTSEYEVLDVVGRLRGEGAVSTEIVADLSWNLGAEDERRGLWLALALGSTKTARGRLEYTYAKVDRDATLAAYASDDFLWSTGWEGHRADLGFRSGDRSTFHVIGQLQRFKDAQVEAARERWVKRLRVELRIQP